MKTNKKTSNERCAIVFKSISYIWKNESKYLFMELWKF